MRKKTGNEARESALVSGWTVEGEPVAPEAGAESAARVAGSPRLGDDRGSTGAAVPAPDAVPSSDGTDSSLETADDGEERSEVSNAMLVLLGVFGGLYLLYTWGWVIVAQAYSAVNAATAAGSGSLGGVLQQIVFWAAPAAPLLWFVTALALSRGGRTRRFAILLVFGAVILLPLPMIIARGA